MAAPRRKKPVNAGYLTKAPSEVHTGFAAYIAETTGTEVPAETVGLIQRLYPLYLKSPAVVKAREEAAAAREAEAQRKAEEKARRVKERLAKVEAQRQKLLAELGIEEAPAAVVVEAADRFTDDKGIEFAESEPDAEPEDDEDEFEDEDGETTSAEVTLADEDDDLWDDEDDSDDEEDF